MLQIHTGNTVSFNFMYFILCRTADYPICYHHPPGSFTWLIKHVNEPGYLSSSPSYLPHIFICLCGPPSYKEASWSIRSWTLVAFCGLLCLLFGFEHQLKGFISSIPFLVRCDCLLLSFLSFHDRFVLFTIFLYDEECCSEFVIHRRLIIFFFWKAPVGSGRYQISLVYLLNFSLRAFSGAFKVSTIASLFHFRIILSCWPIEWLERFLPCIQYKIAANRKITYLL